MCIQRTDHCTAGIFNWATLKGARVRKRRNGPLRLKGMGEERRERALGEVETIKYQRKDFNTQEFKKTKGNAKKSPQKEGAIHFDQTHGRE
jgi:hypothetical protein